MLVVLSLVVFLRLVSVNIAFSIPSDIFSVFAEKWQGEVAFSLHLFALNIPNIKAPYLRYVGSGCVLANCSSLSSISSLKLRCGLFDFVYEVA